MPGQPAPRTWQNRHIVTYEDLQEEIHDWHTNDALGLATNAGEEFAAAGRRELRVQAPPNEPSIKFHSGVPGTVAEWKPQAEIASSSSGVVGQGYYKDVSVGGSAGAGLGQGNVKLYAGNGRASAYNTITRMVFNDEMGANLSSGDPADFVDAGTIFDSLSVGDILILTSDQEVGDLARYRITSIMVTNAYYDIAVSNVANVGTMGSTGRTWRVQAIKRSVVNAADVFGIAPQQYTSVDDDTHILVEDSDTFKWITRDDVTAKEVQDRTRAINTSHTEITNRLNTQFGNLALFAVDLRTTTGTEVVARRVDFGDILIIGSSYSYTLSGTPREGVTTPSMTSIRQSADGRITSSLSFGSFSVRLDYDQSTRQIVATVTNNLSQSYVGLKYKLSILLIPMQ